MEFGKRRESKPKKAEKSVAKPTPAVVKPEPAKPKPVSVSDEHLEKVAAALLGGFVATTNNALDNTKLKPFVVDALALAREMIEFNRGS